jgi:hypothetical protein
VSANTTVYDVAVNYSAHTENAENNLKHVAEHAEHAAHHVGSLRHEFLELGEAIGAMYVLEKGKELFIEVNNDLEKTVLNMATITRMFNKDMSWGEAQEQAESFFSFYREAAKKSASTTLEFAQMHKDVAPAMEMAGASIKDYKEIVSGSMVLSKSMGIDQGAASLSIQHMISGTVMNRDRFSKALIAMAGMSVADFNAKAKNNPQFALNIMESMFNSKAMGEARDHLEHSFEGAISTLKSQVEYFVEQATGPMFETVKEQLNSLNEWIAKNPKKLQEWAHDIKDALQTGFEFMKTAVQFLFDHKDLIITLAETFIALKTMSILGGGAAGGLANFKGAIEGLGSSAALAQGGLAGFTSNITTVVGALAALYLAASALAEMFDKEHKREVNQEGDRTALYEQLVKSKSEIEARDVAITKAKQFGAIGPEGQLNQDKFYAGLFAQGYTTQDPEVGTMMRIIKAAWDPQEAARRAGLERTGKVEPFDKKEDERKKPTKTNVNVTINKIEVASPDPDRFAFGLDKAFKRVAQNPTAARDGLRGGI